MAPLRSLLLLLSGACLITPSLSHGDHAQIPIPEGGDWATRHMVSEHHISTFDSGAFFNLHDYSSRGTWDVDDVLKTYGLRSHRTTFTAEDQARVIHDIFELYDANGDKLISKEEFMHAFDRGKRLPDFGLGPGHHGDEEYEYEIHHFEKYHDENTKEEDLTHPEDIEHFKMHEQMEELEEKVEAWERMGSGIVEENIPGKFRKSG